MKQFVSRKEYDRVCEQKEKYRKLAEETIKLNHDIIMKKGKTIFEKPIPLPFSEILCFAKPCQDCYDRDLSFDITEMKDVLGKKEYSIDIYCKHECVCKYKKGAEKI